MTDRVGGSRRLWRMHACGETLLDYTMRGWSVPPWGLLPQDAGQCEGRGLRLHRVPLKLRSCVRLAEGGCKGRAGSSANACRHARTLWGLSEPRLTWADDSSGHSPFVRKLLP